MNKDEQIGRLTEMCDTLAKELKRVVRDLAEIEEKVWPYHRIVSELISDYETLKKEVSDGTE